MTTLSVVPPFLDWLVYRNDTTALTLALYDDDEKPADLTDWEFEGQVRATPRDNTILAELTITKNENFLSIFLDNSDLEQINYFDIQGTNGSTGTVFTIIYGTIHVEEDVTR